MNVRHAIPFTLSLLLLRLSPAVAESAPSYKQPVPEPAILARGAGTRYANLSPAACRKLLTTRKAPVQFISATAGVANPVRIMGPLEGVQFLTGPKKSPFGIADCRLVLVWLELAPLLREHKVESVRVDNFYRKNARLPSHKAKKSQHAYALATDITILTLADGTVLDVERDFHGALGEPVCGANATVHDGDARGILLRNLVCAIARTGAFHHILTPNANLAHRNHLHLDIARGCSWFSLN